VYLEKVTVVVVEFERNLSSKKVRSTLDHPPRQSRLSTVHRQHKHIQVHSMGWTALIAGNVLNLFRIGMMTGRYGNRQLLEEKLRQDILSILL